MMSPNSIFFLLSAAPHNNRAPTVRRRGVVALFRVGDLVFLAVHPLLLGGDRVRVGGGVFPGFFGVSRGLCRGARFPPHAVVPCWLKTPPSRGAPLSEPADRSVEQ